MSRSRTARSLLLGAVAGLATVAAPAAAVAGTAPSSMGTDFWLAFQANVANTNVNTMFVAGTQATTGTISIPGMGFSKAITVTPGTVTSVVLPSGSSIESADGVEAKGIHVTTGKPVSVYGINHFGASTDAFLGLPVDVLGTDYLALGWRSADPNGYFYGTQLAATASQDDTTVTVTPSEDVGQHSAGVPFTVHLNQGDVYQLRDEVHPHGDLTGSSVTADKPIAVYAGSRISDSPNENYYAGDHHVEQMPPTTAWGTSFLTVPLATRSGGDTFRVLAQQDGTHVQINGQDAGTIDRGKFLEKIITSRSQITADKPVLVAQYAHSSTFDSTTGDPMEMLIPPTEQFLADYTVSTPASDFPNNYINVVIPTAAIDGLRIDGAAVPASQFAQIGGSDYSGAQIHVAVGSHRLTATAPFGTYSYGWATYDGYGYPGGLSLAPVASVAGVTITADTTTPSVGTQDCFTGTVTDGSGGALPGVRVDFTATGSNSATGFDTANGEGQARFCYTGDHAGPDDVTAAVGATNDTTTVTWSDAPTDAPPQAAFGGTPTNPSTGDTVSFDASASTDDHGIASYAWDYGDGTTGSGVTSEHAYAKSGTYTVTLTVTDDAGQSDTVSHTVTVANRAPHAAFTDTPAAPNTGDPVAFDGSASSDPDGSIASYAWDYGDGTTGTGATPSHTYGKAGTYTVTLTVTDDGGATDTVSHTVTVADRPPTAAFTSTPDAPKAGDSVSFDGSASSDPDGSIASYAWDYGDGTTGTGATPSHTYGKAGTYTVTLTVTDDSGSTGTVSHAITVAPVRTGGFVCRASPVRILGIKEARVANPAGSPCADDSAVFTNWPGAGISLSLLSARTTQTPDTLAGTQPQAGDGGTADSTVGSVTIVSGLTVIKATAIRSHADATCTGKGGTALHGESTLLSLSVNGITLDTSTITALHGLTLPLAGLATLHVDSTVVSGGRVTQRALWLESPLGDVVVGEAIAGATGNPCG